MQLFMKPDISIPRALPRAHVRIFRCPAVDISEGRRASSAIFLFRGREQMQYLHLISPTVPRVKHALWSDRPREAAIRPYCCKNIARKFFLHSRCRRSAWEIPAMRNAQLKKILFIPDNYTTSHCKINFTLLSSSEIFRDITKMMLDYG